MIDAMIEIDGSQGEGGGQIVRTALALSLVTGKPFSLKNIRAGRPKPGLQNQHLTCVKAAAEISGAEVLGAHVGAQKFTFIPDQVKPGQYRFAIGTAGSTMLVLQTVLPPLILASGQSDLHLEGGTHNTHAPPFDFIAETFVPLICKMGARITLKLQKYGFYPPGGGKVTVEIQPSSALEPLHLGERGTTEVRARALVVKLPAGIAERELRVIRRDVPAVGANTKIEESDNALSPGNVAIITAVSDQLQETISAIGERGLPAETVAQRAAQEANRYLAKDVAVGEHLADQLLVPLAIAGGGSFLTLKPTLHTTTNIEVIRAFLDVQIQCEPVTSSVYKISVHK
jgi:RNA 3'-terminal phosphate cyclase (ATP)